MDRVLWTDEPVVIDYSKVNRPTGEQAQWEKGVYPIGNGRLGCAPLGHPARERIPFNQESLWVGNEDSTGGYQPFGDIYIEFPHDEFTDYRRELDIGRAVHTVRYRSGGVTYRREYFSSYPAQIMVLRFTADRPGALSGNITMGNVHEISTTVEDETLVMKGDTSNFWFWKLHFEQPERLTANREYTSEKNLDLDFEARVRVLHDGGDVTVADGTVVFEGCDSVTLLVAAETNYVADRSAGWRGAHPHERVCATVAAAEKKSYEELLEEHIADYRELYSRVDLEVGDTSAEWLELKTPERVKRYAEQVAAGEQPDDLDLEAMLYEYARYLMISSSRSGHGGLPANLQGIWLLSKHPPWRCDYHTDINVQMNYWFTSASNLADCFPPLAQWIDSIREVRKEETRRVLGVTRGWLMRSENGIFGGSTWHFQKGDSAWLCQNLWDHYSFTLDRDYLERYAYPVMKEICEFWLDHLKELPDGTLVAPQGRSPEHGPVDVDGVTYDQALCWDLFNNTIEATRALGVDEDFRATLVDRRDRLLGPQIGRWGQLQEWMEDIDDPRDDHRHINHLISVYPGRQVHPAATPELAEAARVSLAARIEYGREHPSWSRVWKACMLARLHNADMAYRELTKVMAKRIYGNLWAVHPPFQIDANFGYAAAVNEMLVQSRMDIGSADDRPDVEIDLLPALPRAWQSGHVKGLRIRGGFEVDMAWTSGELTRAVVRGLVPGAVACSVRYKDRVQSLLVGESGTVVPIQ